MIFFRLSHSDPRYGVAGNIISKEFFGDIPWKDRALYDKVDEQGTGYPYKVELSHNKKPPQLYLMADFSGVMVLVMNVFARSKDTEIDRSELKPETSLKLDVESYSINIIYRKEYETGA